MIRNDLRSEPVRRLVVMGESNAYGMSASSSRSEWVQVLGNSVREFQDGPVRVFNNSIPANVISPDAPGYEADDNYATSPSALERFEEHMIGYSPDLAVYAYGLNDSRCGHDIDSFMRAYKKIVTGTQEALADALIVLVGPYWNLQYDAATWKNPKYKDYFGKFNKPGDELVLEYNAAISELAADTGAIFVDVYHLLEGSAWLLTDDACHFNDIGQRLIGLTVFGQIATRCSFLSHSSRRTEQELGLGVWNTGGTDALPEVVHRCRSGEGWKK